MDFARCPFYTTHKELICTMWLNRLEQKWRRMYIPNLPLIMVCGMGAVLIVNMFVSVTNPMFISYLELNRTAIAQGQVWRLVTFLFIPRSLPQELSNFFWVAIELYFVYFVGTALERVWSSFRFTLYFVLGWLCAVLGMLVTGYGSNGYLLLSYLLAFSTLLPDYQINLFFILPLKAKWLSVLYFLFAVFNIYSRFATAPTLGLLELVNFAFSLIPYFIIFGGLMLQNIREWWRIYNNRRNWRRNNR